MTLQTIHKYGANYVAPIPQSQRKVRAALIEAVLQGTPVRDGRPSLAKRGMVDAETGEATELGRQYVELMGRPATIARRCDRNGRLIATELEHPEMGRSTLYRWTEACRSHDGRLVYLIRGWHDAAVVLAEEWDAWQATLNERMAS